MVAIKRALEPELRKEAEARMKAGRPYAESAEGGKGKTRNVVARFYVLELRSVSAGRFWKRGLLGLGRDTIVGYLNVEYLQSLMIGKGVPSLRRMGVCSACE
jgi:hypothetical protein